MSIWLCPHCGADLKTQNLKHGMLACDSCGMSYQIGAGTNFQRPPYIPPPIPDPESDDE